MSNSPTNVECTANNGRRYIVVFSSGEVAMVFQYVQPPRGSLTAEAGGKFTRQIWHRGEPISRAIENAIASAQAIERDSTPVAS